MRAFLAVTLLALAEAAEPALNMDHINTPRYRHRRDINRSRRCCPITCEIMKDPVLCVEDGHTYERVAVEQWFATGARTSPATSQHLESTALAPNHVVRKLIAALLEEHRG